MVDGERAWTYDALRDAAADMAALLGARGVRRGDRVGILLPKSAEECAAIFATSMAGAVLVPINPLLKAQQIRHIAADAGLRAIFTDAPRRALIDEALSGLDGIDIIDVGDVPARAAPVAEPLRIGEDLAAILYTSGSTGRPKGVMLSHRNLIAGTRIVRTYLGITADERILSVLPFSFDYGLNQLLTAIEQGATLVLLATFTFGEDVVRAVRTHRVTGLAGVPTLWSILARSTPSLTPGSVPSLRYITNSGGSVPSVVLGQMRERLAGTDIVLMYGLTEDSLDLSAACRARPSPRLDRSGDPRNRDLRADRRWAAGGAR